MGLFSRSSKKKDSRAGSAVSSTSSPSPTSSYYQPPSPPAYSAPPSYTSQPYPTSGPSPHTGAHQPPTTWTQSPPLPSVYSQPPIIVNQHYYIGSPAPSALPAPREHGKPWGNLSKANLNSVVNLVDEILPAANIPRLFDDGLPEWHKYKTRLVNQSAALCDQLTSQFGHVMTLIDCEGLRGNENDLFVYGPGEQQPRPATSADVVTARNGPHKAPVKSKDRGKKPPKGQTTAVASSLMSGNYFAKVELYANSKLPMKLPPLDLYVSTFPLLCLAARYSERVYERPRGAERDTHVDADWRTGTKAMVVKSVPMDYEKTIVFAIRGTATFMDWAVNLNMAPTSPHDFLDDPGNFCHAGFLSVARKMIKPLAKRLGQILEENPERSSYSLLMTGHSAGGAVASLLYSHMHSVFSSAKSELNSLTGCFKRIHCITFGAPPVSLLPLTKPTTARCQKSLFLSFVNEGDPVARADKAYVKSLLELLSAPAPSTKASKDGQLTLKDGRPEAKISIRKDVVKTTKTSQSIMSLALVKPAKTSKPPKSSADSTRSAKSGPVWKLPPCVLSCAGRIVVLRSGDPKARIRNKKTVEERLDEGVVAQITTDEQLRTVIWGDPVCHLMRLYALRIETLAVGAITAQGY